MFIINVGLSIIEGKDRVWTPFMLHVCHLQLKIMKRKNYPKRPNCLNSDSILKCQT